MSFTLEKRSADAYFPRSPGSVLLTGQKLGLVYNKYKSKKLFGKDVVRTNLVFAHGTGMNKSMWHYHIKKLYEISEKSGGKWNLDAVISIDAVGHGDSAVLNKEKLGWICKWEEHGKDLIAVLQHEQATSGDFQNNLVSRNIAIGHSYGGYQVILAAHHDFNYFDSIISIEPVIHGATENFERFQKLFGKLSAFLLDDFDTQEEFDRYFKKMSSFKSWDPRVRDDVLKDELVIENDEETGDLKYRCKTAAYNQIVTYLGAIYSLKLGMEVLPLLKVPILHVIGKKATWNAPESVPFIRNAIPAQLLDTVDIEEGEHLVPGERPDEVIDIISNYIQKRAGAFLDERDQFIEWKLRNQPEEIKSSQYDLLRDGKFDQVAAFPAIEVVSKL
jgi:hypothetical protein